MFEQVLERGCLSMAHGTRHTNDRQVDRVSGLNPHWWPGCAPCLIPSSLRFIQTIACCWTSLMPDISKTRIGRQSLPFLWPRRLTAVVGPRATLTLPLHLMSPILLGVGLVLLYSPATLAACNPYHHTDCGVHNYNKRDSCMGCNKARGQTGRIQANTPAGREGKENWLCTSCQQSNFANRYLLLFLMVRNPYPGEVC